MLEITHESEYGYRAKLFIACDNGDRICICCLGPIDGMPDGVLERYGPNRKVGQCCNCGLTVEMVSR